MTNTKKVIFIKNFNGAPKREDESFIQKQCNKLDTAINRILNCGELHISREELYRTVEFLNLMNKRELLLNNLQIVFENHLIQKLELLQKDDCILLDIDNLWKQYMEQLKTIKNIYLKLDRSSNNCQIFNSVHILGTNMFKDLIILNPILKKKITSEIMKLIHRERENEAINLDLLQSIVLLLTKLDVYNELFQLEFLKISESFYADEGKRLIESYNIVEYLKYVQMRLTQEKQRSKSYLSDYTSQTVLEILNKHLIKNHIIIILNKGFENLIENNFLSELTVMYELFRNTSTGVKHLLDYFHNYSLKTGTDVVKSENDKNIIQNLIDLKDKLDNVINTCFNSSDNFFEVLRNSFSKFMNIKQIKQAQLLAKYVDFKLRCRDVTEEELEVIFDKVIVLFRFIQGKDMFEAFYKKDLAKRLLLCKSTSQDAENSMISKLQKECGCAFTTKIEGMFKDISISETINTEFKRHLTNGSNKNDSEFCINVLTNSFWPNYPNSQVNLPPELVNYQVVFQKFYATTHSGRKLFWIPSLAHCIVKAIFDCGNKELQVSLFQSLVLLLFNNSTKLKYPEILELTNIEEEELKRTLISLSCGKHRVLLKEPSKGAQVEENDEFEVNTNFKERLFRVKINQIQMRENIKEEKDVENSVIADRQFQIDAAIVRVMKQKKTVSHNELISELFEILDIPVKPYDLKRRIEQLIEREYMERDNENSSYYTYIA